VLESKKIEKGTTLSRLTKSLQQLELEEHINPNYISLSSLVVNPLVFL